MANYPDTVAVRRGRQSDAPAPLGDAALPPAAAVPLLKYHALLAVGREVSDSHDASTNGLADLSPPKSHIAPPDRWLSATDTPGATSAAMLQLLSAGRTAR